MTKMNEFNSDELTEEIGLLDIYKVSRSKLPRSRINDFSTLAIFTMLIIYAFFSNETSSSLLEKVRKWSEIGFSFSAGILGFLIAGFTIFATVSDKSLFVEMSKIVDKKSGLSYLKYNFFTLMYVFIAYVGFAVLCLLIQLLCGSSGFLSILVRWVSLDNNFLISKRILSGVGIVVVGTYFFYVLIILQSFIFNIYHIVMTSIRWEIEKNNNKNNK